MKPRPNSSTHRIAVACLAIVLGAGATVGISLAQQQGQPGSQQKGQPDRGQPGERRGQPGQQGEPGQPPQPGQRGGRGQQQMSVEQGMNALNRGLRELKASIDDAAKAEQQLLAVWSMQRGALGARSARPEIEGEGAADKIKAFRHEMLKLAGMILELETAVLDAKPDAAKPLIAKIEAFRDEMHKKYNVKDEPEGPFGPGERPRGPGPNPPAPGGGGGGNPSPR
jgi:soluble cytochrome b562